MRAYIRGPRAVVSFDRGDVALRLHRQLKNGVEYEEEGELVSTDEARELYLARGEITSPEPEKKRRKKSAE